MKRTHPKQKKSVKLSEKTRMVRIDAKTCVEASVSLSDKQVVDLYYARHTNAVRPPVASYPIPQSECFKEENVIEEVLDDPLLPDLE
jgi:hypothetical protein